jgi:hypothetical protein
MGFADPAAILVIAWMSLAVLTAASAFASGRGILRWLAAGVLLPGVSLAVLWLLSRRDEYSLLG